MLGAALMGDAIKASNCVPSTAATTKPVAGSKVAMRQSRPLAMPMVPWPATLLQAMPPFLDTHTPPEPPLAVATTVCASSLIHTEVQLPVRPVSRHFQSVCVVSAR